MSDDRNPSAMLHGQRRGISSVKTAWRSMDSLSCFLADQKGAVTTEFTTLVVPFIAFMLFLADASVIYFTYSEMYNTARDIARRMATDQIENDDQALQYAEEHLFLGDRTYTLDSDFETGTVTIWVTINDAAMFGAWFKPVLGKSLVARSTMGHEPLN